MQRLIEKLVWIAEDVTKFNIDPSLIGQLVFGADSAPVILSDIAHLSKNAGKIILDIISKTVKCGGDIKGIGNPNKRYLVDFIQFQMERFYRKVGTTPPMWVELVETLLRHLSGDHSGCSVVPGCDPTEKSICHQLLSPTYKEGAVKFENLKLELKDYLLGNSKRNRRDMPVVMCALGSTSKIEASHARINNRELHRKGSPVNIMTNTLEARLSIGSLLQNNGMDQLIQRLLPWTTDSNRKSFVRETIRAQKRSRSRMSYNKAKLSKKRKMQKQFTSNTRNQDVPIYKKQKLETIFR